MSSRRALLLLALVSAGCDEAPAPQAATATTRSTAVLHPPASASSLAPLPAEKPPPVASSSSVLPGLTAAAAAPPARGPTLAIGKRSCLTLQAPAAWRAQELCFGLDGEPILFLQSRDKDALILVLDSCALGFERCAADEYLAQTGGARGIAWQTPTDAEPGAIPSATSVAQGAGHLQGEPARFWQVLLANPADTARPKRQLLAALADRAPRELRDELASTIASLRVETGTGPSPLSVRCGRPTYGSSPF